MRILLVLLLIMVMVWEVMGVSRGPYAPEADTLIKYFAECDAGDTLTLTEDTAVWKKAVAMPPNVHLIGAGVDATTIIDSSGGKLTIAGVEGQRFTISHIRFEPRFVGNMIYITGNSKTWRIHHCIFHSDFKGPGMETVSIYPGSDLSYGCIDNCYFYNTKVIVNYCPGETSWKAALNAGSADAVYVEDCVFLLDSLIHNAMDMNCGGRYVARYNVFQNCYIEAHSLQNASSGIIQRGSRKMEAYNNHFVSYAIRGNVVPMFAAIRCRGGTGIFFNNTVTDSTGGDVVEYVIAFDNVRDVESKPDPLFYCDGTNPLDGNIADEGWPCLDQIGRSTDNSSETRLPQDSFPSMSWNNKKNGSLVNPSVMPWSVDHIKENRDYVNGAPTLKKYFAYTYPHPERGEVVELKISSLSKTSNVTTNDKITITATGMQASQGNGYIAVGNTLATPVSWSDTSTVFTAPDMATGEYRVYLVNNNYQVDSSATLTYGSSNQNKIRAVAKRRLRP